MREIKFRGKRIGIGEWVYGFVLKMPTGTTKILSYSKPLYDIQSQEFDSWNVDPDTVGQYTGLRDKNGKEIYEGDIIRCVAVDGQKISKGIAEFQGCDYIVRYTEDSASGFYYLHHILLDRTEVIGNIYEGNTNVT